MPVPTVRLKNIEFCRLASCGMPIEEGGACAIDSGYAHTGCARVYESHEKLLRLRDVDAVFVELRYDGAPAVPE